VPSDRDQWKTLAYEISAAALITDHSALATSLSNSGRNNLTKRFASNRVSPPLLSRSKQFTAPGATRPAISQARARVTRLFPTNKSNSPIVFTDH
jgi:hypothetical protein